MKNKNFFSIIFGMAIVVSFFILFSGNCNKIERPAIISVKEQEKQIVRVEVESKVKTDSLVLIIKKLSNDTTKLLTKLKFFQGENKRIASLVKRNDIIIQAQPVTDYYEPDNAIHELIENNVIADSICNETVNNLQGQISAGEQLLLQKDSMYVELRKVLTTGFGEQKKLSDYTKKLERKAKISRGEKFALKVVAIAGVLFILNTYAK